MRSMRTFIRTRGVASSLAVVLLGYTPEEISQSPPLVELHALAPRQVQSQSFALTADQDVQIEAVGAEGSNRKAKGNWLSGIFQRNTDSEAQPWSGNAWILDLSSRKVVWELNHATTTSGSEGTREFKGVVRLPMGSYSAYYAAFPDGEYWTDDAGKTAAKGKWHAFGDEALDRFSLTLRAEGRQLAIGDAVKIREISAGPTIVALHATACEQFQQAGFTLSRPATIEIAVEGEAREDGEFDYGWIINADTRAIVWKFSWDDSDPAGGAAKNRIANVSRELPAGRYAAFYATDDSHDPSQWNTQPPHDPDAWGLRITVKDSADLAVVKPFAYEHVPAASTIVALTGIGDSDTRKQGFTLTRPMDVRIYALGEGRGGRMYDYGWITAAGSRARVWDMTYDTTEPAGGDRKNRLVDTTVHLQKGSYVLHYLSDDSHSSAEWNAAAPADGHHWGITLLAAAGPLDRSAIAPYEEKPDPSILAQAVGIRDDDRVQKRFSLERAADVKVYAVGEASGREMADYGWIEDAQGHRVWEMTYKSTQHAGGASKNRRFEGTIHLPPGQYIVGYETDDSHAFGDWNADPPDDPEGWGITVSRMK